MNTPLYVFQKRAVNHSIVCVIEDVPGHSHTPENPQTEGETRYFHPVRRIIIRAVFPLHEEMNSASRPGGSDPGFEGCIFIQWMKKRGGIRRSGECRLKARECGFDADWFVKEMGMEFIATGRTGDGKKVIYLVDLPWADRWMIFYDLEVPHHRHWKKWKK